METWCRFTQYGRLLALAALVAVAPVGLASAAEVPADLAARAAAEGSVPVIVTLGTAPGELSAPGGDMPPDRAAVASAQAAVLQDLAGTAYTLHRQYEWVPQLALSASPAALAALAASPGVVDIQEDKLSAPALNLSIPFIDADNAWALGFNGDRMHVAILDTGVRRQHPFLSGKVVWEACFARGQDGAAGAGDCPNGLSSQAGTDSGRPCTHESGCDHGTHVAGIAAGTGLSDGVGGGPGVPGVGRFARIIAIQIFSNFTNCPGNCVLTWTSDQIAALNYVYALRNAFKIASSNMSIGGGLTAAFCDGDSRKPIIDLLLSAGIATVIASGNNGSSNGVSFPSCISSAVTVGSTLNNSDTASGFSNMGVQVDLMAPGSNINASAFSGTNPAAHTFEDKSGTSMATPHVAGAWAVMKEKRPYGTVAEILTALQATGANVTKGAFTRRRIDLDNAANFLNFNGQVLGVWDTIPRGRGQDVFLWALVRNNGAVTFPSSARAWFWVDGLGYVASVGVGGLAPGATSWYAAVWTLPTNIPNGVRNYWSRIWDSSPTGFWVGPWAGPEQVSVIEPAVIQSLWPVGTRSRGQTAFLWSLIRNNSQEQFPTLGTLPSGATVWKWVQRLSDGAGGGWKCSNSITGLLAGQSAWYLCTWVIPSTQPTGTAGYWARTYYFRGGTWYLWDDWFGPTTFTINP